MNNLKPCPFCGGEAHERSEKKYLGNDSKGINRKYIECLKCNCRTMSYDWDDEKEMVETWNKRVG